MANDLPDRETFPGRSDLRMAIEIMLVRTFSNRWSRPLSAT